MSTPHYHHAPAVRCTVTRSGMAGVGLAVVIAVSAVVIAGWWAVGAPSGGPLPILVGLGAWGLAAALATVAWLRSPRGAIEWDGAQWWWTPAGKALPIACNAPPAVHLDFQRFLLITAHSNGQRLWLALEKGQAPHQWPAFRRAVYSRARSAGSSAVARSTSGTPSP